MVKDASLGIDLIGHDKVSSVLAKMGKNAQKTEHTFIKSGKKMALAMAAVGAAAGAAAIKLGVDSVKAAMEDEKAARKLEQTLQNVTHATKKQTDAVERYITKTSLRTGVEDDKLRPALARLVRSTEDVTKAQDLLNLSLDITAATGRPLELVANTLGKAYDGNTNALGRLGLGLDASLLKSKDMGKITDALRKKFKNFADNEANTFEGKLGRIKIAFNEAKETVGGFLLDGLQPLVDYAVNTMIPAMDKVAVKVGRIFGDLIKGDTGSAKRFAEGIEKMVVRAARSAVDAAPQVLAQMEVLFAKVGAALPGIVEKVSANASKWKTAFSAWITKAVPQLLNAASKMIENLATYLSDHGGDIVASIVGWILKSLPDLIINLAKMVEAIGGWIREKGVPALAKLVVALGKALITGVWKGVTDAWPTISSKLGDVGRSLANAFTAPFRAAFNEVAKWWNESIGNWSVKIPDWIPLLGGKSFDFPNMPTIPALAAGGIVTKPTLAMVGEAGPEAVVPLKGRGGFGGNIYITVEGSVISERDLVFKLRNELGQLMRRQSVGTAAFGI